MTKEGLIEKLTKNADALIICADNGIWIAGKYGDILTQFQIIVQNLIANGIDLCDLQLAYNEALTFIEGK